MAETAFVKLAAGNEAHTAVAPQADEPGKLPAPGGRARPLPAGAVPGRARPSTVPARPVQERLRGAGRPLSAPLKEEMETRLGTDLSDVRVHTDAVARATAAEVGARAYTWGSHVVIGDGGTDRHTLAHELTHVIQQRQDLAPGAGYGERLQVSSPHDREELAAEANAARVMRAPVRKSEEPAPGFVHRVSPEADAARIMRVPMRRTPMMELEESAPGPESKREDVHRPDEKKPGTMDVTNLPQADKTDDARRILGMFSKPLAEYPGAESKRSTGYNRVKFDGGIFTIGATHTGDMYDVAFAHTIVGRSIVIVWGVNDKTVFKAAEIARFLNDSGNVFWTADEPPEHLFSKTASADLRALAKGEKIRGEVWVKEGGATTIVTTFAKGSKDAQADMRQVAGPEVSASGVSLDAAISKDLAEHGFREGKKYAIVNYRQSGHSGAGNAPALDTGEKGFLQLLLAVGELGLEAVPMGEIDPAELASKYKSGANLVEYWSWPSVAGYGRRAEARLLRVLTREYNVVAAVGMRSGVTDLLSYLGVPTLSIDIHPRRGQPAKGWQRPLKREAALGGRYRIVSLLTERDREMETGKNWPGSFSDRDLAAIKKSFGYLAGGKQPPQWPQHPAQTAGIYEEAKDIARDVEERIEKIDTARKSGPPQATTPQATTPQATGKRKGNALMELMLENEALKAKGVSVGQMKTLETDLRATREKIDLLLDWLYDEFTRSYRDDDYKDYKNRERDIDDAIRILKYALKDIEKILSPS
jgi:hypothetical protein